MTREEQAKLEIGHTDMPRAVAVFLTFFFLVSIVSVPVVQHLLAWIELRNGGSTEQVSFYREFRGAVPAMRAVSAKKDGVLDKVLAPNSELLRRMVSFNRRMDDVCFLSVWSRPWMQDLLCRTGAGNEKVFVGRDGWLFYEPDVRHVTGHGFLDPRQMLRRQRSGGEWQRPPQPDPVSAIVHFRDQLRARGVELVVMPVPVKPSIRPDRLTARVARGGEAVHNLSYEECIRRLSDRNVRVFDCSPVLADAARKGDAYFRTDTHWRPETMARVASALAGYLSDLGLPGLRESATNKWSAAPAEVRASGDIAVMLKLPEWSNLYAPEHAVVAKVVDAQGARRGGDPSGPVLFLGDSFANIFSLPDMGWGDSAGLAEHLAMNLGCGVDRIVRNDSGSFATREMLANDLARGRDRLAGKKVVVWEFADREFSWGDWVPVQLPEPKAGVSKHPEPDTGTNLTVSVSGVVAQVSSRPEKGAVYSDYMMKLYVTGLKDDAGRKFGEGDAVIHVLGMKNREILPIASVQSGDVVRFRIRKWDEVESRYGRLKTGSLPDVLLEIEKPLYWGLVDR